MFLQNSNNKNVAQLTLNARCWGIQMIGSGPVPLVLTDQWKKQVNTTGKKLQNPSSVCIEEQVV